MRKKLFIACGGAVILSVVAGLLMWYMMMQPLYRPGMVRSGENLSAPLQPPEQVGSADYFQVEKEVRLFKFQVGSGRNVLVIHGGPGFPFAETPEGFLPLTSSYRLVFYDQRGAGKSTRPFDRFTSKNYYANMKALDKALGLGAQIADIERIRQILGEDRIILLGHSFGGFLASLYAAEFPDHVRGLILVAPANLLVMPPPGGGLFENMKEFLPSQIRSEYESFINSYLDFGSIFNRQENDLIALNRKLADYYQAAMKTRGLSLPEGAASVNPGGWMVWAMYFSMGRRHDFGPPLHAVKAPVLVLHGEKDLQTERETRLYAEAFPQARFQIMPDAGHFMFYEKPVAFADAVRPFLDSLQ